MRAFENNFGTKEFEGEAEYYKKFIFEELKLSTSQYSDNLKLYKNDFMTKASDYLNYFYLIKALK